MPSDNTPSPSEKTTSGEITPSYSEISSQGEELRVQEILKGDQRAGHEV